MRQFVQHLRVGFFATVFVFGLVATGQAADTIVTKRINATNRLIPLKKITVGPADQYQGSVDPYGETLVFTRKSDLIPRLCTQNLKTGEVTDFLPLNADSQEPTLSPDGKLGFAYYKYNARGDICYRSLKGKENDKFLCLKADDGELSAPFWKSNHELGYLIRDMRTQASRIIVQNLETGARETLAEGRVWSPAMKAGGRYLFYNELVGGIEERQRVLVMKDLQTKTTKVLKFALPGISGFPSPSGDENYLFFSHYLNDTNDDNIIDGNDNSVVFRVPVQKLLKEEIIFPEQLTSAESNCSFPRPHLDELYVTCAFEGNLDIYRLPVTGVVPSAWGQKLLESAHRTSRTYQQRVLILDTMKFRLPQTNSRDLEMQLFSDHLLSDDTSAARYYLRSLQKTATPEQNELYELLHVYLQGREMKKAQPSEEVVTPSFEKQLLSLDAQVDKVKGNPSFRKIVKGLFRTFLNQPKQSAALLRQVKLVAPVSLLERYYFFELANWTLPRIKASNEMTEVYRQMISAPELSEESQIFYAFDFLQHVHDTQKSVVDRLTAITAFNHQLPAPTETLLKSEEISLRLIQGRDEKAKGDQYRELDKLMSSSRADYYLRKALYVRAILNFAESADFNYLSFVASNWLRYTTNEDTEFAYAREVYVNATLDQAYENFGKTNYPFASDYFYGSLSLTDDLESHYGYIRSMLLRNQRPVIDTRYENLKKREFIDDNMKFVRALLTLIDSKPSSASDVSHLDAAILELTAMEQDRDSPVRYLLLGYCYMDKLLRTANGYGFDTALFDQAHRNLMLAYDVGRDNVRIKAAALMDLGLLHQRVQNHGLSSRFFAKRKELGFTSKEEEATFDWFFAKALFYAHDPTKAVAALDTALNLDIPAGYRFPLQERRAFYLQNDGKFELAARAYEKLLAEGAIKGDLNLAKANLAYGYSLYKLKKATEAERVLKQGLIFADRLQKIPKGGNRAVDFEPIRLKLNAYGLLGKIGTSASRLQALEMREKLLPEASALFNDETSLSMQTKVQAAQIYAAASDPARAAVKMKEALKLAEQLGDSGQYLSHAVYQTAVNYLTYGIFNPALYASEDTGRISRVVDKVVQTYEKQKDRQPMLDLKKTKLKVMWAGFQSKVFKNGAPLAEIKSGLPAELENLANAVAR